MISEYYLIAFLETRHTKDPFPEKWYILEYRACKPTKEYSMKPKWLSEARLIPEEILTDLRILAVRAVIEKGPSPEEGIRIFGRCRSGI